MVFKAGIIGCGRIGSELDDDPKRRNVSSHAGAYFNNPKTELTAVSDLDMGKLEKCSKRWNVTSLYKDYKKMLEKESLDILSICTWNRTHLEIAEHAVRNDVKAIFCEKPVANTLNDAHKMVDTCWENGTILQIDHQRRFCDFHGKIRDFINKGRIGGIQQVSFYYTAGIANTGSHMFDLLRFFFGEASWVMAFESTKKSPNKEDPNLDGFVGFENNITCSIQACDVNDFLIFEVDIIGTQGRLRIVHSGYGLEYYRIDNSDYFSGYKELNRRDSPIDVNVPRESISNGVKWLIKCIETGKESISTGLDGLKALELICAFHESANQNGKKIRLPLKHSHINIKSR